MFTVCFLLPVTREIILFSLKISTNQSAWNAEMQDERSSSMKNMVSLRWEASLRRRRKRKWTSTAWEITCAQLQQRHTVRRIIRIVPALLWHQYGFRSRFIQGPLEKIETCSFLMSSRGLWTNPDPRFDLRDPELSVSPHRHYNKPIA